MARYVVLSPLPVDEFHGHPGWRVYDVATRDYVYDDLDELKVGLTELAAKARCDDLTAAAQDRHEGRTPG